jgi:aldehyde dehydrogenase (NAD+)
MIKGTLMTINISNGQLFINSEWRNGSSNVVKPTYNPATETFITDIAQATEADIDAAIDAADDAFKNPEWAEMSPLDRSRLLIKVAQLVERDAEELATLESIDMGKPKVFSLNIDTKLLADLFYYYAGVAAQIDGVTRKVTRTQSGVEPLAYTQRVPLGVIAAITPFNFPMLLSATKFAPALAAGNTIVHKPASATPLTAIKMAKIFDEAGLPKGVFNLVTGSGALIGNRLVDSPKVKKIAFTGSTEVGKSIAKRAIDSVKKVTLELGGKSAHIIFDDANLEKAITHALFGIYYNKGEICTAGSRLLVQRPVYEEVLERLHQAIKSLVIGDPLDLNTTFGPQVDRNQVDTCHRYVEQALQGGARLITGGQRVFPLGDKGHFYAPTILADVDNSSPVAQEEIFGPVLCVIPFDTEDEAVKLANESKFGLAAGIQTENISRAHRVSSRLEAGLVWVNTYNQFDVALPFGGFKESGIGRELGTEVLDAYTQIKSVYIDIEDK